LTPAIAGLTPFDIERVIARMDAAVRGHTYAKAAIEMALFDLQGKIVGQPVFNLLGGRVHDSVEVTHMVGIMDPDEAEDEVRNATAEGTRSFQIKGTGQLRRDVDVVRRLRSITDESVTLRFDANQGYRGRGDKGAIAAVRELVAAGVDLIEQPSEGLARLAAVRRSVDIPVIADESVWQPHDVVDAVREGAVDAISVYVAKAGGLSRAKTVAAVAEVFGLPCDVNGSLESGVGNAANLHFGISTPACTLGCVIPVSGPQDANTATSGRYFEDDVVKEPMSFVDGGLVPSDRPGLGFEIDEDKLREHSL
jgi:muconate cycloisomerase